jgi:hypothetical protein
MKKISFSILFLYSFILLSAQEYIYNDVIIEIMEVKNPKDLDSGCISMSFLITDQASGISLPKTSIIPEGQSAAYPYISNKKGEILIITDNIDPIFDLTTVDSGFAPIRLGDFELKRGTAYLIKVQMIKPIRIIGKPLKPIESRELPNLNIENITFKPIIYLYPSQVTDLELALQVNGNISFSYPKHNDGWECTAMPNGDIKIGEKTYPYLFWEGKLNTPDPMIQKSGFVVKSENIVAFLEEKLAHIGLNDKEMTDFITFWAPRLEQNAYSYLHFSIGEEYAKNIATLEINIKPDAELHVHLFHSPVGPDFKVQSQELQQFVRKGFTLIEWGGGPIQLDPQN